MGLLQNLAPTLQRLDLQWAGGVDTLAWALSLPSLQSLDLDVPSLTLDVSLSPLTSLSRLVVSGRGCWCPVVPRIFRSRKLRESFLSCCLCLLAEVPCLGAEATWRGMMLSHGVKAWKPR